MTDPTIVARALSSVMFGLYDDVIVEGGTDYGLQCIGSMRTMLDDLEEAMRDEKPDA